MLFLLISILKANFPLERNMLCYSMFVSVQQFITLIASIQNLSKKEIISEKLFTIDFGA